MGYPGEPQQYQRAMNRMAAYNLRRMPTKDHDAGAALGAGMGTMLAKSQTTASSQAPTHDPAMYQKYVTGTGAHVGMAQHGVDGLANQALLEKADQNVANNQLAEDARIGGAFTPAGLEKASQVADANAQDRLKMRSLIGLAGTQVQAPQRVMGQGPPAMGPGMGPGAH